MLKKLNPYKQIANSSYIDHPIPDKEGNLLIDVSLPNGIDTSYDKKIEFQQEMTGTADIITENLRLIERLLYQFRDIFSR